MQHNFNSGSESPAFQLGGAITLKHIDGDSQGLNRPEQLKNQIPVTQNQNFGSQERQALIINAQSSAQANLMATHPHQFNTPSNCYQAVNINYTRDSVPKNDTNTEINPLSQNSYDLTAPLHSNTPGPPI